MTEYPAGSSSQDEGASDPPAPRPAAPEPPASPFARPQGYTGNIGDDPAAEQTQEFSSPPRFASSHFAGAPVDSAADYTAPYPAYGDGYGPDGEATNPWGFDPPPYTGPYSTPAAGLPRARSRKPWILVTLLVIALVAGATTIGLVSIGSSSNATNSPATNSPAPNNPAPNNPAPNNPAPNNPVPSNSPAPQSSGAPGAGATPDPNSSANPLGPLPNIGIPTPPGLVAIGYHAYSSGLREPAEVAIDAAEQVQFRRYGLSQIVGLRALTIGRSGTTTDDYDADISVLRFKDAASAKAELEYSNSRNKKDSNAVTIALPGLPNVTAFLNQDSNGYSIGAFASIGRYQVVLILGALTPNVATNPTALAAEAARVMKALLPDAAIIKPEGVGGGSGQSPTPSELPRQAPTQAPSKVPAAPSATPSGIHA